MFVTFNLNAIEGPQRVVDLLRKAGVPVHLRNVPVIVLKKRSNISAQTNENNNSNNEFDDDMINHTDKNDTQDCYTEQIICIPPHVNVEYSSDQSKDSTEDFIHLEFYSTVAKH